MNGSTVSSASRKEHRKENITKMALYIRARNQPLKGISVPHLCRQKRSFISCIVIIAWCWFHIWDEQNSTIAWGQSQFHGVRGKYEEDVIYKGIVKRSFTESAIERYLRVAPPSWNAGSSTKSASEGHKRAAPASWNAGSSTKSASEGHKRAAPVSWNAGLSTKSASEGHLRAASPSWNAGSKHEIGL